MLMSKMSQFSRLQSKYAILITIPILVTLVTFTSGEVTHISVMEEEDIQLDFSYHCGSKFTLQHSFGAPFYDSANPELVSLPDNQVLTVLDESGKCVITLRFIPASRSDKGIYILTVYTQGGTFLEDTRMWLDVRYPPEMESCEWSGEHIVDDWVSLNCRATAGSLSGRIVCYQNEFILPYLAKPAEVRGDILEHTLWARHSQPAFCCAVIIGRPVDRCDCKDYKWDPHKNVTEPCPFNTLQPDPTPSQSYTPLPTRNLTKQGNTEKPCSNDTLQLTFHLPLGTLVLVVICLTIALIMSRRRASKLIMRMENLKKNFGRNWNDYHD